MNTVLFLDMFAAKSIQIPTRSVKKRYFLKKITIKTIWVPVKVNEISA